ncbi:hypothetical protein WNY79_19680 [Pseudoalteromonas sp. AS84]|uniref:hypothetical protein n=1 Tax=Pseudoalteromonas sp. AS84 TaxID=3135778 RepID=UPI00316BCC37
MFAQVAKVKQHQQRLTTLLKHKQKLQAQGVYPLARLNVIESQLLNHLYTLSDLKTEAPIDYFAGKNLTQVSQLVLNEFIAFATENAEHHSIYTLLLQSLNIKSELNSAETFLALKSDKHLSYYGVLQYLLDYWQLEDSKALRNSVLNEKEQLDSNAITLLFSQHLSEAELSNAMLHANFDIAYAALVNAYCNNADNVSDMLFKVFAKTNDDDKKAKLLALAGLTNDPRWDEPCLLFCKANPGLCKHVLSHFVYKRALPLFINLMAYGVTQKPAYAAWLIITNRALAQAKKVTVVESKNAQNVHSGINLDDAEHARQAFAIVPGDQLLNGISFAQSNAKQKLKMLAGEVVQRVIAPHYPLQKACGLYHVLVSAKQWQSVIAESPSAE